MVQKKKSSRKYYETDSESDENEWGMTPFEKQMKPILPTDLALETVKCQWNDLASEMKCPVCLNLIEKTMITEVRPFRSPVLTFSACIVFVRSASTRRSVFRTRSVQLVALCVPLDEHFVQTPIMMP